MDKLEKYNEPPEYGEFNYGKPPRLLSSHLAQSLGRVACNAYFADASKHRWWHRITAVISRRFRIRVLAKVIAYIHG